MVACIFTAETKQANVEVAEGFERVLTRLTNAGLFLGWVSTQRRTLGCCSWIAKRSKADASHDANLDGKRDSAVRSRYF